MLVVDRSPVFAEALALLVSEQTGRPATHAVIGDGPLAIPADVAAVVLDADGDTERVASLAATIRTAAPDARLVLLVAEPAPRHRPLVLATGAAAWLSRQAQPADLVAALDATDRSAASIPSGTSPRRHPADASRVDELTPRERTILGLLAIGTNNDAIAAKLGISPYTVRTHVQSVLGKLGVHSRLAAVALAQQAGMVALAQQAGTGALAEALAPEP